MYIPKFLNTSFKMTVDQNAVIKIHNGEKSNVEIAKRLDMNRSRCGRL